MIICCVLHFKSQNDLDYNINKRGIKKSLMKYKKNRKKISIVTCNYFIGVPFLNYLQEDLKIRYLNKCVNSSVLINIFTQKCLLNIFSAKFKFATQRGL